MSSKKQEPKKTMEPWPEGAGVTGTLVSVSLKGREWAKLARVCLKVANYLRHELDMKAAKQCPSCKKAVGPFIPEEGQYDTNLIGIQRWKDMAAHLISNLPEEMLDRIVNRPDKDSLKELLTRPDYISPYIDLDEYERIKKERGESPFGFMGAKIGGVGGNKEEDE